MKFEDVMYCVNHDRFFWYIKKEECISLASDKINSNAALLLKVIFDLVESQQKETKNGVTAPCTSLQIASVVAKNPTLSQISLSDYLDALCSDSYQFLSKIDDKGEGTYVISEFSLFSFSLFSFFSFLFSLFSFLLFFFFSFLLSFFFFFFSFSFSFFFK